MAVVQISKIQVRRGLKNSGIGVPQLSSAEFAWAVDSQELFIGNGSVAEGAPYVGNTKILTEHDNILELASSYRFGSTEASITDSVNRSLQLKLDEYVSVLDFGAVPDGSTDNVEAFQAALNQLFQNPNDNFKKVLIVPNGTYLFTGNLKVPSTAIIQGETQSGAVLDIGDNNILFVTEDGKEVSEFTDTNRPYNIKLSNITILHTSGQTVLTGIKESTFDGVKFVSTYDLTDSISDITENPASVFWENTYDGTKVTDILFKNCKWEMTALGVRADQITIDISSPPIFETHVNFIDCEFNVCHTGILINGILNQVNNWKVYDTKFVDIYNNALNSTNGTGTNLYRCEFTNCGSELNHPETPVSSIVSFGQNLGNTVLESFSNRHRFANIDDNSVLTVPAINEVVNSSKTSLIDRIYSDIYVKEDFFAVSVFGATSRFISLDYHLMIGSHSRTGQINITISEDLDNASFTDNYSYSSGESYMIGFEFNVELKDNDTDSGIDTLVLSYRNPSPSQTGRLSYSISYGV